MAKHTVDVMLDKLQWEALEPPDLAVAVSGERFATHRGILEIAGHKLRAYQLNTGERVLDADDVAAFFGVQP